MSHQDEQVEGNFADLHVGSKPEMTLIFRHLSLTLFLHESSVMLKHELGCVVKQSVHLRRKFVPDHC